MAVKERSIKQGLSTVFNIKNNKLYKNIIIIQLLRVGSNNEFKWWDLINMSWTNIVWYIRVSLCEQDDNWCFLLL